MGSVFGQSAVILLREGLEALLVLAALAAYLVKAEARDRLSALYTGAALAVAASLIAAWVFQVFNNGEHNDLFEAFVILAAAALMLYVSGWLLLRQDPQAWQRYLHEKADAAIAQRAGLAVGLLAFLAVFREGAETVLFVYALAKTSGGFGFELIAGLVAAAVGLVVLFFVINTVAKRARAYGAPRNDALPKQNGRRHRRPFQFRESRDRSHRGVDPLLQLLLRRGADLTRRQLAVLEDHQRRDRHDAVLRRRAGVLVDVQLHDLDLVAHGARDLFESRRDHAAGAAPLGPEVDHDRAGRLEHLGLEIRVGNLANGHGNLVRIGDMTDVWRKRMDAPAQRQGLSR